MSSCQRLIALVLQTFAVIAGFLAVPAAAATHIVPSLLAEGPVSPGETVTLAIAMRPEPGWHGYWSNPGDAGLGMTLDWTLPPGAHAGTMRYPVPRTLVIAGLMNHVFEEDYALLVPLSVPGDATPGIRLPIRVHAEWLACTEQICVPEQADLSTEVAIAAPGAKTPPDARFDAWRAKLPAPLDARAKFEVVGKTIRIGIPLPHTMALARPHVFAAEDKLIAYAAPQEFRRQGNLLVVTLARPEMAAATPTNFSGVLRLNDAGDGLEFSASPGAVAAGGEPVVAQPGGATPPRDLVLLLMAALVGGLILNVMPCVFPILSLKALSLARAGESAAEARREGLAYTAGTIVACLALGGLLLVLRAGGTQVGWAFQLQEPGVVAALLLLAVAITANLAGLYEFAVPGFVTRSGAGSPQGAFATGLLAAFVATPCTGPFMAAAMGAALLLPAAEAMALFGALGLGLALPFLGIALIPALRRALPRPGRWMGTFRRVLAIPMALTAVALGWLALRLGGPTFAWTAVALGALLVAALAWAGRLQRRGQTAVAPMAAGLAAIAIAGAIVLPGTVRRPDAEAAGIVPAKAYSAAALAEARRSGHPVFAWFTADWCLTCKVNEQVAIERPATRDAFAAAHVIVLRGDWTRRDPEITRFLTEQGAAGVPLYVWYPAGGGAPQTLPQLLGPDTLPQLAREKDEQSDKSGNRDD